MYTCTTNAAVAAAWVDVMFVVTEAARVRLCESGSPFETKLRNRFILFFVLSLWRLVPRVPPRVTRCFMIILPPRASVGGRVTAVESHGLGSARKTAQSTGFDLSRTKNEKQMFKKTKLHFPFVRGLRALPVYNTSLLLYFSICRRFFTFFFFVTVYLF